MGFGPLTAKMCILVDYSSIPGSASPFTDWEQNFLFAKLRQNGISPSDVRFEVLLPRSQAGLSQEIEDKTWAKLSALTSCDTVLAMGEMPLRFLTDKRGIDKWQCSPLSARPMSPIRKVMPCYPLHRLKKQFDLNFWISLAIHKVKKYEGVKIWPVKAPAFYLNPPVTHAIEMLERIKKEPILAVDIETGRGQINTIGFAWSERDAIAINVLPSEYSSDMYYKLWTAIADVLESDAKKVMQNGLYEIMWLSTYGININNFYHDTMWANKYLWPELEKGLDSVGRIYTMEPYWKDEGKGDWNNVRDWISHYRYNCLDCAGTFEAHLNQLKDMENRGIRRLWDEHVSKFAAPLAEMSLEGLPIDENARNHSKDKIEAEIAESLKELSIEINPRSPKQKLELFKAKGYKIPQVRDPVTKGFKESLNELSLKKLRRKYPTDNDIKVLLDVGPKQKALSSYLEVEYSGDRVHYMYDGHGTETGRFSCRKDHRGQGFNAQTLPKYAKKFIAWSDDRIFIQCDLKQAESRFVAYDAADSTLIEMLEDETKDIHSYVAAEIFRCSVEQVIKERDEGDSSKRQLGKKSGHGANYAMKETTFMDSCLKEMDLVIDKKEAKNVLEAYHRLFPGIRQWHERIRTEVRQKKKLVTPMGRERYFFGRIDDDTFREAYAYRPQSTVPDITNCLMLKLCGARTEGMFDFKLHLQVHDSLVLSCSPDQLDKIAEFMLDTDKWHPELILPAGKLVIPTDVEWGKCLGELRGYELH